MAFIIGFLLLLLFYYFLLFIAFNTFYSYRGLRYINVNYYYKVTHILGRSAEKFLGISGALKDSPVFPLARKRFRWKCVFHLEVFKRIHQPSVRRAIHGDICAAALDYGERGTN